MMTHCAIIIPTTYGLAYDTCIRAIEEKTEAEFRIIDIDGRDMESFTYARAINQGIDQLKGTETHVCFMNDDTIPTRRWLSRLITKIDVLDLGAIGPFGAFIKVPKEKIEETAEQLAKLHWYHPLRWVDHLSGYCLIVPSKIIERVGRWDENYEYYFEDTDYTLRIHNEGYPMAIDLTTYVWHQEKVGFNAHDLMERKIKCNRSQLYFERKFGIKVGYNVADKI